MILLNEEIKKLFKRSSNQFLGYTFNFDEKVSNDKSIYENKFIENREMVIKELERNKITTGQLSIDLLLSYGYYFTDENYTIIPYEEFIRFIMKFIINENETIRLFTILQHYEYFNNKSIFNLNEFHRFQAIILLDKSNLIGNCLEFYKLYYHKSTSLNSQRNTSDLLQCIFSNYQLKFLSFLSNNSNFKVYKLLSNCFQIEYLLSSLLVNRIYYNQHQPEYKLIIKLITIIQHGLEIENKMDDYDTIFKKYDNLNISKLSTTILSNLKVVQEQEQEQLQLQPISTTSSSSSSQIKIPILPNEILSKIINIQLTSSRVNQDMRNDKLLDMELMNKSGGCHLSTLIFNEIKFEIRSYSLTNWQFFNLLSHCLNHEINWHKMKSKFKIGNESFFHYEISYEKYCLLKPIDKIDYQGLILTTPFNKVNLVFKQLKYLSFSPGLHITNSSSSSNGNINGNNDSEIIINDKFDIWDTSYSTFPNSLPSLETIKIKGSHNLNSDSLYHYKTGKFLDVIKWVIIHSGCNNTLKHFKYKPQVGFFSILDQEQIIEPLLKYHSKSLQSFTLSYTENDQDIEWINFIKLKFENYPNIKFINKIKYLN